MDEARTHDEFSLLTRYGKFSGPLYPVWSRSKCLNCGFVCPSDENPAVGNTWSLVSVNHDHTLPHFTIEHCGIYKCAAAIDYRVPPISLKMSEEEQIFLVDEEQADEDGETSALWKRRYRQVLDSQVRFPIYD
jgi:hypothetical protein